MTKSLRYALLALTIAGCTACAVSAQKKTESSMKCSESRNDDRLHSHCEIKEQTLPASGAITVDGKQNGGVSIKGWERNEILVRSKIESRAPTQSEADLLAQQVRIETGALNIHAEGPESRNDYQWYVSYEIFVPRRSDLSLAASNGGISISDVHGKIEFNAKNGGVSLRRVGGRVHVELDGIGAALERPRKRRQGVFASFGLGTSMGDALHAICSGRVGVYCRQMRTVGIRADVSLSRA